MKKLLFLFLISSKIIFAQLVFSNGDFKTGVSNANSQIAPVGYQWSELQSPGSNVAFGGAYNNSNSFNTSICDDFTVPSGETWNITSMNFYGYIPNHSNDSQNFLDVLHVRIWNGNPLLTGSQIIWGDLTTNRIDVGVFENTNTYRIDTGENSTNKKIYKVSAITNLSLTTGTYWVEFQAHTIYNGGFSIIPVTISGTSYLANWNAKYRYNPTSWIDYVDSGTGQGADVAFDINYSNVLANESFENNYQLAIYPNPSHDFVKFNTPFILENTRLTVYDVNGRIVIDKENQNISNSFNLNISFLEGGIYFIVLKNDKIEKQFKLTKP